MSLAVREATRADAPRVWDLILELADYEKLAHLATGSAEALAEHAFGPRPVVEILVAETAGAVVGYTLFFPTYSTFLTRPGIWMEDLYVTPSHRGRGIGKALLFAVAERALARGCGRLEWSVLDWNAPSIAFYESLGAKRLTEWQICRMTPASIESMLGSSSLGSP
ncbi:MAG: GNAT family N-acetyltransferase [Fimbriimonadaceae bacterium]|nr:GNAT family N-acetyltransferase [Fimbriimonadaceae bacterium]